MDAATKLQLQDLRVIDGDEEPRVQDLRIAEILEQSRPRDIRKVILRNIKELERHGTVMSPRPATAATDGCAGYWLNEAQALLICMRSNAPKAADGRTEIIQVFMAWRRGQIVPFQQPQSTALVALEELFDRKLEPLHARVAGVEDNIIFLKQRQEQDHALVMRRLDDVVPRHAFPKDAIRQFIVVVQKFYGGKCPCCRQVDILKDAEPLNGVCHIEHFNGRDQNKPGDGWLTCNKCNYRLKDEPEYKILQRKHFEVFQDNRRMIAGAFLPYRKPKKQRSKSNDAQGMLF